MSYFTHKSSFKGAVRKTLLKIEMNTLQTILRVFARGLKKYCMNIVMAV